MASSRIQRELALLVTGKDVSASKALRNVNRSVSNLERHASKATRNMGRNLERGVVLGATAAGGAIAYAVKQAIDWESAFAGVRKTVEGTPEELEAIAAGLRAMSRELPVSATELAAIAENAGALGIKTPDILAFTRVVAMIGTTTDVSTDQAATALGQLQNVLGLTGDDFDNFASTLVDLGNKGASTESQILEIARRSGGAAKLIGAAKDETLGWAAAAANLGLNEELAGTALQNFFLKAVVGTQKGSKNLELFAETAGTSAAKFRKAFATDASGALESFVAGLGKLPKDKRLAVVQKLFGKGSGLTRLVLGLAESYDRNLAPSIDTASEAWEENTAAAEEARKRYETTASQLQILRNNIDDAAVTIGTALLPQLAELAREGTAWIQDHQPEIEQFSRELADGLRDAVTWARSLDWDAIASTLQAGAGVAKGIVEAFVNAPPWVQQFLTAGFVANKFTGGVIGDIVGEIAKGAIKGVLGINAGVVNVTGGIVNTGGGVPGGGGAPGTPVAAGAAGFLAPGFATLVAALAVPIVMTNVIPRLFSKPGGNELEPGRALGLTETANQTLVAIGLGNQLQRTANERLGTIATHSRVPNVNPSTGFTVNTPRVNAQTGFDLSRVQPVKDEGARKAAADSLVAFREAERASEVGLAGVSSVTRAGAAAAASATSIGSSRIVSAIQASRPVITTQVKVYVTPAQVKTSTTTQERYGPSTGSAGSGHLGGR